VTLWEMRPATQTPAHHTGELAELVCSNSFGARAVDRATGLLQEELRRLGSLVIQVADAQAVPAGGALAVDRVHFSRELTERLAQHPRVTLRAGRGAGHSPWHCRSGYRPSDQSPSSSATATPDRPGIPQFFRCRQPHHIGRKHQPGDCVSRQPL
jgi:hypothetical protein